MSIGRRGFLTKIFGAGATVTALHAIAPLAFKDLKSVEVRRDRQYIFRLPGLVSQEHLANVAKQLEERGLNAIVIDSNVEIFELNG
jgi:hypothetical protein